MLFSNTAADDTNRVRIKLCGLTLEDDVLTAVQSGAMLWVSCVILQAPGMSRRPGSCVF